MEQVAGDYCGLAARLHQHALVARGVAVSRVSGDSTRQFDNTIDQFEIPGSLKWTDTGIKLWVDIVGLRIKVPVVFGDAVGRVQERRLAVRYVPANVIAVAVGGYNDIDITRRQSGCGKVIQQFTIAAGVFVWPDAHAGVDEYLWAGTVGAPDQMTTPLGVPRAGLIERKRPVWIPRRLRNIWVDLQWLPSRANVVVDD